jgi:crossover junction endodeoxyribonuclease RuvC
VGVAAGAAVAAAAATPLAHRAGNVVHGSAQRARVRVHAAGVLRLGRSQDPLASRLMRLADELRDLILRLEPDEIALEEAFFGKSVQSALRIGEARGVILAEACRQQKVCTQFPPATVKRTVTGLGSANKEQVAKMVVSLLQLKEMPECRDVTDALAVALCGVERKRSFLG